MRWRGLTVSERCSTLKSKFSRHPRRRTAPLTFVREAMTLPSGPFVLGEGVLSADHARLSQRLAVPNDAIALRRVWNSATQVSGEMLI